MFSFLYRGNPLLHNPDFLWPWEEKLLKTIEIKEKESSAFPAMLPFQTQIRCSETNLFFSFAIAFNLDKYEISSFGKELNLNKICIDLSWAESV